MTDLMELTTEWVEIEKIHPNDWNPNVQDDFIYERTKVSLLEYGWRDPVKVRGGEEGYEIVDGEHRWKAAKAILDGDLPEGRWKTKAAAYEKRYKSTIPIINYGDVSREQAQELTLVLNNLSGEADTIKLADLVDELKSKQGLDRLVKVMPFQKDILESLIALKHWDPSEYQRGGELPSADEWIELVFRVPEGALEVIEGEIARIGEVLEFKKGLSDEVRRGLILEKICALSGETPIASLR